MEFVASDVASISPVVSPSKAKESSPLRPRRPTVPMVLDARSLTGCDGPLLTVVHRFCSAYICVSGPPQTWNCRVREFVGWLLATGLKNYCGTGLFVPTCTKRAREERKRLGCSTRPSPRRWGSIRNAVAMVTLSPVEQVLQLYCCGSGG